MKAKWEKIDVPYEAWEDYNWDYKVNGLEWDGYDIKTKTHPIWVWKWFIVVEDRMNRSGWLIYDGLFDITYSSDMLNAATILMRRQKGHYGYNMSIQRKEKPRYAPFTNTKTWGDNVSQRSEYHFYEYTLSNILKQVAKERIIDQYGDYEKGVEINKAKVGRTFGNHSVKPYEKIDLFKSLDGYGGLRTKWVAQRICEYIYGWQLIYLTDQSLLNHSYMWRMRGFRWWA